MSFNNIPNKSYVVDGETIWHSRSVALNCVVFALFNSVLYTLVTKRSDAMPDEPGKWCVPCGYLDWNESIYDATIRELYEETDIDMRLYRSNLVLSFPAFQISSNLQSKKQNVSISSCFVLSNLLSLPEFKLNSEVSEIKWATKEELAPLDLAFGHERLIDHALIKLAATNSRY